MLRRMASNSSRWSVSDSTSDTMESAASRSRCSARATASWFSRSRWGGSWRASSACATASIRSALRRHSSATAHAAAPPPAIPSPRAAATVHGEAAPVAARTTRTITSGISPAITARNTRSQDELAKRLRVEAVAHAANREDQLGVRIVAFDMLAQPPHVNIDRSRFDERVSPPDHIEQLFARIDAHRVLDEEFQQFEFAQRQVLLSAVDEDLVGAEVDLEAAALVNAGRFGFARRVGASEERLDARDDLARAERLNHVVVRAHLEAEDLVHLGSLGGNDKDREVGRVATRPHLAADFEARRAGKHQVEQKDIGDAAADLFERLCAVGGLLDEESFAFEVVAQQFADVSFVLDDQYA